MVLYYIQVEKCCFSTCFAEGDGSHLYPSYPRRISPTQKLLPALLGIEQDTLYGSLALEPVILRLMDTPQFQRLHGLKQLGTSDFVFRGSTNTRFEHSVGGKSLRLRLRLRLRRFVSFLVIGPVPPLLLRRRFLRGEMSVPAPGLRPAPLAVDGPEREQKSGQVHIVPWSGGLPPVDVVQTVGARRSWACREQHARKGFHGHLCG